MKHFFFKYIHSLHKKGYNLAKNSFPVEQTFNFG